MLDANGVLIESGELQLAKAKALASYLQSDAHPEAVFLEARHEVGTRAETIVFEVHVELSQDRKYPVLPQERIAVSFTDDDEHLPEVVSLREDFPTVPHLNLRETELPRSLCLYDVSYDALKLRWTPAALVERVREWLSLTSAGELHQADQPLEPLILGSFLPLILEPDFYSKVTTEDGHPKSYTVTGLGGEDGNPTAYLLDQPGQNQASTHRVTVMLAEPREHGALRRTPQNLRDLMALCEGEGFDLRGKLREELPRWKDDEVSRRQQLVLIILFPKVRERGAELKEWDTLAFVLLASLEEIGTRLGIWQRDPQGRLGALLRAQEEGSERVQVAILNPVLGLTKCAAAAFNGTQKNDDSLLMVGLGALGSMLLGNLVRKGYGRWQLIDKDTMLPHNGARHLLPGTAAGYPKAFAVRTIAESMYRDEVVTGVAVADTLHPKEKAEQIAEWFRNAAAIIDCSADIPTARHLALEAPGNGRRISVFLSPTGEDLVMLVEDAERRVRLDVLEMQYYALLLDTPELAEHLAKAVSRVRYGRSCRDLSAILSADAISRNAAIASRKLSESLVSREPSIRVWKGAEDGGVSCFARAVAEPLAVDAKGARVEWDEMLVAHLRKLRSDKLPRETGGALLGQWDQSRRLLYVVGATKAPSDSKEEPTSFVRGSAELKVWLDSAAERTGGSVQYIGEWHSHPDGFGTEPSGLDRQLFRWISESLAIDGLPPVMLIVGQHDLRWVLEEQGTGTTWNYPN